MTRSASTFKLARPAQRQQGSLLIFSILFMACVAMPMFVVLFTAANLTNSSLVAQGAAYNMSYAALSRSLDACATQQSQTVQLADPHPGVACADFNTVTMQQVQADLDTVAGAVARTQFLRTSGIPDLVGTSMSVSYSFNEVQASPVVSGQLVGAGHCDLLTPGQVGLTTQPEGGGNVPTGTSFCWRDRRPSGGVYRPHTTTGVDAEVSVQVPLQFVGKLVAPDRGTVTLRRYGASVVTRRCQDNSLCPQ